VRVVITSVLYSKEHFIGIMIVVNLSMPIPASTLPEIEDPMTLSLATLTVDGP
jgi:hypothetical protein